VKEPKLSPKKLLTTGIRLSLKPFQETQVWFQKSKNKNGHMTKAHGLKNGNLIMNKFW